MTPSRAPELTRRGLPLARLAGAVLVASLAPGLPAAAPRVADPEVRLAAPSTLQPVEEARPEIRIELAPGRTAAVLLLDRVDVTALSVRSGRELRYRPDVALGPGTHVVRLVLADAEGPADLEWSFVVAGSEASTGRPALHARGALSLSGNQAVAERRVERTTAVGNLSLAAGAATAGVEAALSGSLGFQSSGPGARVAPGGFLLSLRRAEDSLLLGDVSFATTPYVAGSLARRGLLLTLNHLEATLQAFQVASSPVRGLDAGVRLDDYGDQLWGASLKARLLDREPLQVGLAFVQGRTSSPIAYGVAGIGGPTFGRAAGLQVQGSLLGTGVILEGALSSHDADTRSGAGARTDGAASLRLARPLGPVQLQGSYERIGPDFASVGSPGAVRDRQELGLSASAAWGPASVSASLGRGNDNLGRDATRPRVTHTTAGTTVGLALPGWPGLTLGWFHGVLGAEALPAGQPPVDTVTDTATAALTFSRGGYTASASSSLSWLDDRKAGGLATTAASVQLAGSARLGQATTVAPSLARTEVRTGGTSRVTELAAVSASLALLPGMLTLQGQGSFASSRAGDQLRSDQWGGALRLGWEIHRLFERWARIGGATLSASGRYLRARDRGASPRDLESYAALVSLDLFLPFDLRGAP